MYNRFLVLSLILSFSYCKLFALNIIPGAEQFDLYLPLLAQKRVAVFTNNAAQIKYHCPRGNPVNTSKQQHPDTKYCQENLVSALIKRKVNLSKIFTPEHGFTLQSDAGSAVSNTSIAQIPVISLYGTKLKPGAEDLKNVDILLFDIQDVGVRYYTYISSLQKLMEAATENNKPLIILDRPNPNGFYIDGPVLESGFRSFVGMQNIPLAYGMTIGEYARMLVGEQWLALEPQNKALALKLTIIPLKNYNHASYYKLTTAPSPNLPNMTAVYWYPSLGLFEGTKLSVGRGTFSPFQVLGNPLLKDSFDFSFTPRSVPGALNPPWLNQQCFGWDLRMEETQVLLKTQHQLQLDYLINAYRAYPDKANFFTPFFDKLAGTATLRQQIKSGISAREIRLSWQSAILNFKQIRERYLLYPDK